MTIIEICLIIIALCFTLLLCVGGWLAIYITKQMKGINQTVTSLEYKLNPLIHEATNAMLTTCEIATKLKEKISITDPLFSSISKICKITESLLSCVKTRSENTKEKERFANREDAFDLSDWIELLGLGANMWQKIKKRMD